MEEMRLKAAFKFSLLNDYCLLEVFKYLNFKERVKLERLDKRTAQLLARIWSNQRVFLSSPQREPLFEDFDYFGCKNRDHRIRESDVWFAPNRSRANSGREIVRRCPNLLAFYWFNDFPFPVIELPDLCPRLEHIYFDRCLRYSVSSVFDFLRGPEDANLRCLQLPYRWALHPLGLTNRGNQIKIRNRFPRLTSFSVGCFSPHVLSNSFLDILISVLPFLEHLDFYNKTCDPFGLFDLITSLGTNLESLSYSGAEVDDKQIKLLIQKLPKLRAIDIQSKPENMQRVFSQDSIEKISWDYKDVSNQRIYTLNIPNTNVKSLKMHSISDGNLDMIPLLYPNLEELQITFAFSESPMTETSFSPAFVTQLKYLRKLYLESAPIDDQVMAQMLKNCLKLREIYLFVCKQLSASIFDYFKDYCRLRPKRVVKLHVDKGSDSKQSTELISDNLRVFFV